jgi:hypothetical protein
MSLQQLQPLSENQKIRKNQKITSKNEKISRKFEKIFVGVARISHGFESRCCIFFIFGWENAQLTVRSETFWWWENAQPTVPSDRPAAGHPI